jgi:transposase
VDARGQPIHCILSEGQAADITYAQALIEGIPALAVLADKGYDADQLLRYLKERNIKAVIPPRANRLEQRDYDRELYKNRNLVERFFNRIKQFRRVATRYEKLARNFLGMLTIVCFYIGLA